MKSCDLKVPKITQFFLDVSLNLRMENQNQKCKPAGEKLLTAAAFSEETRLILSDSRRSMWKEAADTPEQKVRTCFMFSISAAGRERRRLAQMCKIPPQCISGETLSVDTSLPVPADVRHVRRDGF